MIPCRENYFGRCSLRKSAREMLDSMDSRNEWHTFLHRPTSKTQCGEIHTVLLVLNLQTEHKNTCYFSNQTPCCAKSCILWPCLRVSFAVRLTSHHRSRANFAQYKVRTFVHQIFCSCLATGQNRNPKGVHQRHFEVKNGLMADAVNECKNLPRSNIASKKRVWRLKFVPSYIHTVRDKFASEKHAITAFKFRML